MAHTVDTLLARQDIADVIVDRFERRDGEWRIAHRVVATEWRRVDPVPRGKVRASTGVTGQRDATDVIDWIMTAVPPG